MANNQEDKGFKVVDRRIDVEEQPTKKPDTQPTAPPENEETVKGPGWEMHQENQASQSPLHPMDFTTFCLSLASSTIIHLGQSPHPETGQTGCNLPLAKQTIDILALLEEKTRNNLTADESKLLATLLYDLRLRYVESNK